MSSFSNTPLRYALSLITPDSVYHNVLRYDYYPPLYSSPLLTRTVPFMLSGCSSLNVDLLPVFLFSTPRLFRIYVSRRP